MLIENNGGVLKMARKKRSPIEELSRKGLTDQRYIDPQDARIQERKLKEALDKLSGRKR